MQAGDTLQSIAQDVYGNGNLWYVIADANALTLDSSGTAVNLVAGTTLKLPAVRNEQNTSHTFTPYNPLRRIGSTTPALAYIPPAPQQHCRALTDFITVAVTVMVTAELGPAGQALSDWAAAGEWAVSGMAANLAAQATTDVLGLTHGLSLEQVLAAGVTSGVTGGLSNGLIASAGSSGSTWVTAAAGNVAPALTTSGDALVGAAGYLAGTAGAALVGEPTQFSWAGMAAAALGSAAAAAVGLPTNNNQLLGQGTRFMADLGGSLLDSSVTREASLALGDQRVQSWTQIAADAFGNAVGNAIVQPGDAARTEPAKKPLSPPASSQYDQFGRWLMGFQNGSAAGSQGLPNVVASGAGSSASSQGGSYPAQATTQSTLISENSNLNALQQNGGAANQDNGWSLGQGGGILGMSLDRVPYINVWGGVSFQQLNSNGAVCETSPRRRCRSEVTSLESAA